LIEDSNKYLSSYNFVKIKILNNKIMFVEKIISKKDKKIE